jgi:hypothetical protein
MTTGGTILQVNECETVGPGEERTKMVWGGGGVREKTTQRRLAQQLFNYQVELCSTWLQWTMSTGVVGNQRTGEHAYNGQT